MKKVAYIVLLTFIYELTFPISMYALSGGPSQPEVQSFEPIGTTEMVDMSSGDFVYNIPLLDVDGYPINISYHSGISMDQEASWVGLGWNINPGVVNRNMRGVPDDFKGDSVRKEFFMKPNQTWGANYGTTFQLFGKDMKKLGFSIGAGLGIYYNNYKGVGFEFNLKPGISAGDKTKGRLNAGLGLSASSSNGIGITPSVGFSRESQTKDKNDNDILSNSATAGASFNSRTGLKAMTFGFSSDKEHYDKKSEKMKTSRMFGAGNGGSAITFANPTYIPSIQMPMTNWNITFNATLGGEIFGGHPAGQVTGYYSEQRLTNTQSLLPAFGFFFSEEMLNRYTGMMDFNREKDGAFTENTPSLPLTNFSYDLYSVSGQGIGGMYKPFRSDIGTVYDSYSTNESYGGSAGAEFGGGNAFHGGVDLNVNTSRTDAGSWLEDNPVMKDMQFRGQTPSKPTYEPFYFKNVGEKTADPDENYFSALGGFNPVRVALNDKPMDVPTMRSLVPGTDDNSGNISSSNLMRKKRQRRNENISYLSGTEASIMGVGLTVNMLSYSKTDPNPLTNSPTLLNRVTYITPTSMNKNPNNIDKRKGHHISEIRTTRQDGAIYVYGIAAYNTVQEESTFNVNGIEDKNSGLVSYVPDKDNTVKNENGIDHYYSKTTLPAYAHSYLLTAILSPDYVDLTGDGPSVDDYGTYTKFNYTRFYGPNENAFTGSSPTDNSFLWRVPIEENKASLNEGLNTDKNDDKGSVLYGKKEIWYMHSVETKNYVAEFIVSNREDGLGVSGPNGGKEPSRKLQKLKKIVLYARNDLVKNGAAATPIKTVNFEYTYDLCGNYGAQTLPNNSGLAVDKNDNDTTITNLPNVNRKHGKLTLTKLYFTYGKSNKGKLNSYQFTYAGLNPTYNLKGYDRWGNYMPNPRPDGNFAYDFPYVDQGKYTSGTNSGKYYADVYASAWNLSEIKLPSGGKITVNYESDDYAYVQDKPAMQMFKIKGIGNTPNPSASGIGNMLISDNASGNNSNYYLYIDLPEANVFTDQTAGNEIFRSKYLNDILDKYLYYKFRIRLTDLYYDNQYEYISGYTKIEDDQPNRYGVILGTKTAYIRLEPKTIGDQKFSSNVNPIARAAWQFTRLNTPKIAYGEGDVLDDGITQVMTSLGSMANSMSKLLLGFNRHLMINNYGKSVDLSKSYVRLYTPEGHKLGGGSRVKKLSISDEWSSMSTGSKTATYSQIYEYKLSDTDPRSSGVASYEPIVGGDENPFREPVFHTEEMLMALDNEHYMEKPFGESFFPSPSVVYSRIKVTNVAPDRNAPTQDVSTRTGYIVHEFYTARDFPTITQTTGLRAVPKKPMKLLSLLKLDNRDFMTASQGFSIELNDMHGKPKAQWVYAEGNPTPISGVVYKYKTNPNNPKQLENTVSVIDEKGSISPKQIGVDMDMVADSRESNSKTESFGLEGNLDGFLAAFFPALVPVVLPAFSKEHTRFRSSTITKVINRYGILDTTIAYQDGAYVKTENLAFDQETGEVLLTRTYNEYNDPIYNLTYPAHWFYDKMGPAYKNIGLTFKNVPVAKSGEAFLSNADAYFVDGDELLITNGSNQGQKAWAHNVTKGRITLIDKNGKSAISYTGQFSDLICNIKIIRSGRRNQQSTSVGSITMLDDPYGLNNQYTNQSTASMGDFTKVLNASVTEFSDQWQTYEGVQSLVSYTCNCPTGTTGLEPEITTLKDLLSNICLNNSGTLVTSTGKSLWKKTGTPDISYTYYGDLLKSYLPYGDEHRWFGSASGNILTGEIRAIGANYSSCKVVLDYTGSGITPSTVIQNFISVTPVYKSTNCPDCDNPTYSFQITANTSAGVKTLSGYSTCYPVARCTKTLPTPNQCGLQIGDIINPYYKGVRGNWKPLRSLTYLDERTTDATNRTRYGGVFKNTNPDPNDHSFPKYYKFINSAWTTNAGTNWVWTNQVTKINPQGNELEVKDALNRFSAELFGYNNSLVKAVASNAKYTQIAFDNFEDYNAPSSYNCSSTGHWDFIDELRAYRASVVTTTAHSGKSSLQVPVGNVIAVNRNIVSGTCSQTANSASYYRLKPEDCLGRFSPEQGSCVSNTYTRTPATYILSAWVREISTAPQPLTYTNASIQVYYSTDRVNYQLATTSSGSGSIIEGWQRIYSTFIIPANAVDVSVRLNPGINNTVSVYFDDIRLHPFNSNMKSYVYDPETMRLVTILDENNYATFYEYDEEGALARVKKESQEGIYTIQEVRTGNFKKAR